MQKNAAAVLDVGSYSMKLIIGERGPNKTFKINYSEEFPYGGFSNGDFLEEDKLSSVIGVAIQRAELVLRDKIDRLFVGVPGEFTFSYCKNFSISLLKKKRVSDEDIAKLYDTAYAANNPEYKLITRAALYFVLSGGRKVSSALGHVSDSLGGIISFHLCKMSFIRLFAKALKSYGVGSVEYYPSYLAEALYLFEPCERDRGCTLVDIGYITSSFCSIMGNGTLFQKSFSLGGGYITAKLVEVFKIPYNAAEALKRQINVFFSPFNEACYEFEEAGKYYSIPVKKANNCVKTVLDEMAEQISKCMDEAIIGSSGENAVLSLTGGGISYMRGAKEYLGSRLGVPVQMIAPDLPVYDKPINSSLFSMLNMALNNK